MDKSNTFLDISVTGDTFLVVLFGLAGIAVVTVVLIRLKQVANNKKEK